MAGEAVALGFSPGLVHAPVTPFTSAGGIDYDVFGKLLEFHLRNGAEGLALPMHIGESVSLTDEEQRALIEFAVKRVRGRNAIMAHVSDAGTGIAASRARFAETAGVSAIIATTPYYWTPPAGMLIEHFAAIGAAVKLPFYVYNTPEEMPGTKITAELCLKLIDRAPNFAGVIDLGLDWQFMIELLTYAPRRRAAAFQLIAGTEHMVSAAAIGARGLISSLAAIAPRLVRTLYDCCRNEEFTQARPAQERIAALRQRLKPFGAAGLKAALRAMGRDCGEPRPPLMSLPPAEREKLAQDLKEMEFLKDEPRGW
jgi:4-hydroxy-tetrahydrodipicolinate synthase